MQNTCPVCNKSFIKNSNAQKYCSLKCGTKQWRLNHKEDIKMANAKRYPDSKIIKTKICEYCGNEFYTKDIRKIFCSRSCSSLCWQKNNPDKHLKYRRITQNRHGKKYKLCYKYNIGIDDVFNMYEHQNHRCKICSIDAPMIEMDIDHDHTDGRVRGLLCKNCNKGIGKFKDNKQIILNAIEYLKKDNAEIKNIIMEQSVDMPDIKCVFCGKLFKTIKCKVFCSNKCYKNYSKHPESQYCYICDAEIFSKIGSRFCSNVCMNKQWCLDNYSLRAKTEHMNDINQHIERLHNNKILSSYGITLETKHKIFELQSCKCAICRTEILEENLYVDHDHNTKIVRGLLCRCCNFALGNMKDSIEILYSSLKYLEEEK